MSLFGAMSTAISGLNAQSAAFTNISDNTANSETVGFKAVNTNFIDYLSTSSATQNQSGSVVTTPSYQNNVQGTIQQSSDPLALAIDGNGFFQVSQQIGTDTSGNPVLSTQPYYTRAGDFELNSTGYLVNSAGDYLNGWSVNTTTGILNTSEISPIQVQQTQFQPVATTKVTLLANVPTTPTATSTLSSNVEIYDATGTGHQLTTTWSQVAGTPDDWTLTLSSPDNTGGATIGTANVQFNPNGTIGSLSGATGSLAVAGSATTAALTVSPSFNGNAQNITLNLGTFGTPSGVTQFAGTDYDVQSITQDGAAPGAFTGISIADTGAISANYDNGRSVQIAQVPLITFENADALQRQNGQAFTQSSQSGVAIAQNQNQNGAGTLVTGSTEASNVDIATQLSALIVAQQAYGANAKVISTANQMLQATLDLKQ